jgi:spore coat polysaccharide biosynthesis protein SpsF
MTNNLNKILIIVQARISSTRLPGKVLKKVIDKPLLWYVVKRLNEVKSPNKIIIATGDYETNKVIVDFAKNLNLDYFIGSENDVLDRYYQTAKAFNGDIIVRITSDCPLIDPDIIDQLLIEFKKGTYDYISNVHPPTYPDGYDTEIFTFNALETAWKEAKLPSEREHVTPYIWKNKDNKFKIKNFKHSEDLSKYRLTVDTHEDFKLISIIVKFFHDNWTTFRMRDVIKFLEDNKELLKINIQYQRDEGYTKSLEEDKKFLKR